MSLVDWPRGHMWFSNGPLAVLRIILRCERCPDDGVFAPVNSRVEDSAAAGLEYMRAPGCV